MDLTEAEDIKKRWQEYTEELYKKELHDPDNHDGVITDLDSPLSPPPTLNSLCGLGDQNALQRTSWFSETLSL